ncbi:sulfatase-like hydrolase/transferase [Natrarchaeobius chitinivorans]|uniref:Sulfatase N-terminal domain-containing protein n=1 Tax=Natrarchaeobius chitinivorans TaxID=1679083 RepID=A0A3N6NY34_NATCH|nr:sulfatase-like hydrolase/transferase [Natrarchaeobius chitinivorans]RQG89699.1 hypothetical protein EA473_21500 [Natrarchaeobius chitinivorans]
MTEFSNGIDISNVYIFISDALRWSALPESISNKGVTFKTVSAGCATMRSVSSIVTGLNPPRHGVSSWTDQLTEPTLFDLPNLNSGFYNPAAGEDGGLNVVLDQQSKNTLDTIEPPFVYLERDQGGHAPYADYSYEEMLSDMDHTKPVISDHYNSMIKQSVVRFEERLRLLEDRGLREDTLIIFLSDHGELLGEYGLVSHSSPPVPELVYVPTVFIHPKIERNNNVDTIGHIDLMPTISDLLDVQLSNQSFDGINIFEKSPGPRYNDAMYSRPILRKDRTIYHSNGIWDGEGGHVFTSKGKLLTPLIGLKKSRGWNRKYWKTNPSEIPMAIRCFASPYRKYGNPQTTKDKALKKINTIQNEKGSSKEIKLDDSVEEQLKDLGYR